MRQKTGCNSRMNAARFLLGGKRHFIPKPNLQPGIKEEKIRGQKQTIEGCLHKSGRGYGTIKSYRANALRI